MFGVVPKVMWEPLVEVDDKNRIELALRPFLAEGPGGPILIESGIGPAIDDRFAGLYEVQRPPSLLGSLEELGVDPGSITAVALTHMHWDHAGGCLAIGDAGRPTAAFAQARHVVPQAEVLACLDKSGPRRASYDDDHAAVLADAGVLEPFEGRSREVIPGVTMHVLGGHSLGSSVVTLETPGAQTAVFWADVLPTAAHVHPAWIMAFDEDQVLSFEVRSEWIGRAADDGWIGLLYHDLHLPFGAIHRQRDGRFSFDPLA